jgi:hypothetical protein
VIIVVHRERWQTDHVLGCMSSLTALSAHERTVDLRPSFFEKHSPKLILLGLTESRLPVYSWEPIVDNDRSFFTIDVHGDAVDTGRIRLSYFNSIPDTSRFFGARTQNGQEVTITELTLVDIIWINVLIEDNEVVSEDILRPLPLILSRSVRQLARNLD